VGAGAGAGVVWTGAGVVWTGAGVVWTGAGVAWTGVVEAERAVGGVTDFGDTDLVGV